MDIQSCTEFTPQLLPPPPGSFIDREELIQHVGEFAISQGYVVTIKQSNKDRFVILGCDRGGVYRNRRRPPIDENTHGRVRTRKAPSRLTNCPFECVAKKQDGLWALTVKNGSHNHEAFKDISEHPSARRFTETEVLLIKEMTEAGLKPRQILKRMRQHNPEFSSTPKQVYNIKAKLRQGNLRVRTFKSLRPQNSAAGDSHPSTSNVPSWRQRYPPRVPNLIAGRFVDSMSKVSMDVLNPATQQVVSQVPLTTNEEFSAAVFAAKRAFPSWRNTPFTTRQRVMFKFQELIRRDIDKLASDITTELGKTLKEAYSDVLQGLEVVEHACGMANPKMGEFVSDVSYGIDTYSISEPLGVCAGISSCSIPAMIPLWMFPVAVMCGNTFILKPSEKDPGASVMLAELAMEAGLPSGVLNIVHGTSDIVDAICNDEDIKAIAFVGSESGGTLIYARASARGKRVQSIMGAQNHAIVMPDASVDRTLDALVAAGFGAAGQRCMPLGTVVFVGNSRSWEDKLAERAQALKVNAGSEPDSDVGPVISKQAKERICKLIQDGVDSGARLVLDGRNVVVPKYELGNFIGPTILSDVTDDMEFYEEEIVGPVLLCMQADSLHEAINIVNRNKYGIGASIFTSSSAAARKFQTQIEAGQVGINVPIRTPLPFFSFTGSKASFGGDLNFYGKAGVNFYTQIKTVSRQWKDFSSSDGIFQETQQAKDFPSDGEPLAAQEWGDFPSGSDGVSHLPQQWSGFPNSIEMNDFPNGNGMSLAIPNSDGSQEIQN